MNNLKSMVGYQGSTFISDTDTHTGSWQKILCLEATVFATLTDSLLNKISTEAGDALSTQSFPANCVLTGAFTVIDLTSGAVMAYK